MIKKDNIESNTQSIKYKNIYRKKVQKIIKEKGYTIYRTDKLEKYSNNDH